MTATIRLQATVEVGPNENNRNWQVFEISPDAFEDQERFDEELYEVEEVLETLERNKDMEFERNDSGGPLADQVRKALLDMSSYVDTNGTLPPRKMFVFALPGENENLDVNVIPSDSMEDME